MKKINPGNQRFFLFAAFAMMLALPATLRAECGQMIGSFQVCTNPSSPTTDACFYKTAGSGYTCTETCEAPDKKAFLEQTPKNFIGRYCLQTCPASKPYFDTDNNCLAACPAGTLPDASKKCVVGVPAAPKPAVVPPPAPVQPAAAPKLVDTAKPAVASQPAVTPAPAPAAKPATAAKSVVAKTKPAVAPQPAAAPKSADTAKPAVASQPAPTPVAASKSADTVKPAVASKPAATPTPAGVPQTTKPADTSKAIVIAKPAPMPATAAAAKPVVDTAKVKPAMDTAKVAIAKKDSAAADTGSTQKKMGVKAEKKAAKKSSK